MLRRHCRRFAGSRLALQAISASRSAADPLRGVSDVAPSLGGEFVADFFGAVGALAQHRQGIGAIEIEHFSGDLFDQQIIVGIIVHYRATRREIAPFRRRWAVQGDRESDRESRRPGSGGLLI
jgi:hypothetical protein